MLIDDVQSFSFSVLSLTLLFDQSKKNFYLYSDLQSLVKRIISTVLKIVDLSCQWQCWPDKSRGKDGFFWKKYKLSRKCQGKFVRFR